MLWLGNFSSQTQWTLTFFLALAWLIGAFTLRVQVVRPLQALSNMVAALREEDLSFRERGVPHQLLLISDLSRALREEERQAWQRLIRVLGHELNNSLAPIKSIAGTLRSLASRPNRPADWNEDVERGLEVIESRADALSRFMQAYTKLARLPAPTFSKVQIESLVKHAAGVEARLPGEVVAGDEITLDGDPDQLEQLLINVVRNAVDASLDPSIRTPGSVQVGWSVNG